MARKRIQQEKKHRIQQGKKHLAYLAFRLGCLPYMLIRKSNKYLGYERKAWRLVNSYDDIVTEGLEAIASLRDVITGQHESEANAAHQALTTRWQKLRPNYDVPMERQDDTVARPSEEHLYAQKGYRDGDWQTFSAAIRAFWSNLPKPCLDYATLGSALGDALTAVSEFSDPDVHGVFPGVPWLLRCMRVQTLISNMADEDGPLVALAFDPSEEAFQNQFGKERRMGYRDDFVFFQLTDLYSAIVERLRPSRTGFERAPTWISASAAVDLAHDFKIKLNLTDLSKLAKKVPPPFDSKKVGHNRLFIELSSFVTYLWDRRDQRKRKERQPSQKEVERRKEKARALKEQERNAELGGAETQAHRPS